jgi:hypothetical protein
MTVGEVVGGVMSALTNATSSPPTAAAAKPATIPNKSTERLYRGAETDPAASAAQCTVWPESASDTVNSSPIYGRYSPTESSSWDQARALKVADCDSSSRLVVQAVGIRPVRGSCAAVRIAAVSRGMEILVMGFTFAWVQPPLGRSHR